MQSDPTQKDISRGGFIHKLQSSNNTGNLYPSMIFNLSICMYVCLYVYIFAIFSKMLSPTRLKLLGGYKSHAGVVYGEFGEDPSKAPPLG